MDAILDRLNLAFILPLLVLASVSWFLVWHPRFDDGLFGRIFLAAIIFFSVIMVMVQWQGGAVYDAPWELLLVLWGVAGYMARHAYRFRTWCEHGDGDWRQPEGKC